MHAMLALSAALALVPMAASAEPYPADSYSRPAEDRWEALETVTGVQPAGDPVQRLAQWERNDLRATTHEGAAWTAWRFVCRPGQGAVLCFNARISRAPAAISVRVANRGAKAVAFAVSMGELPWVPGSEAECRQWVVSGDQSVAPGEEAVVRFDAASLTPDRPTPRTTPAWPTTVNLHVAGPEAGVEYALDLREWTVRYAPAEGVTVGVLTAPEGLAPGEEMEVGLAAAGVRAGDVVDLEVRGGERTLWRVRLTEAEKQTLVVEGRVTVRRTVPWYLPARRVRVGLVVNGYRAAGAEATALVDAAASPGFPRTERRLYHGRPTVFVEGQPLTWSGYASYEYQPGNVAEFGASGANVMVIPTDAGRHVHQIVGPTWDGAERYDFGELDELVCQSLQANPAANLLLRVSLALPVAWLQAHPDSIVRVRTKDDGAPVAWEETGCLAASIASRDWQAQQEACLRALIAHCEAQPWAGRVIGFMPTGEVTEEWFAWGCNDGYYADYSPVSEADFARWSAAQGLPWTSVPAPSVRQRPGWDTYPDDETGRQAADYSRYANELAAQVISRFAAVIKEATQRRSLVGVFHGYVIQLAGEPRQCLSGQFGLRQLLDCPDVDFLAGIPLHNFRELVGGYDCFTSATESIAAAGKLFVNENDLFSWLHHAIWTRAYDPADPRGGAISMHRRVIADDMVHGALHQWFSLLASWHHDAGLQADFARQIGWQSTGVDYDRTDAEEVALVVDDASFDLMPPESRLPGATHPGLLGLLGRTGAPVGVWLLRDLDRLPQRVKLVVIANATAAQPADLGKLETLLGQGGRTVVVLGAPGLVDRASGRWDEGAPARLLGLPLRVNREGGTGVATVAASGETTCGLASVRPRVEGAGEGWLRFADGPVAGLTRDLPDGGRLIWSAVPPQTPAVVQGWVESAGAHCYAPPGFSVHASRELVAITAAGAGEALLRWPRVVAVHDLYDGWQGSGQSFVCPFAAGQTRLFVVAQP